MNVWFQASNAFVTLPEMIVALTAITILLAAAFTKESDSPRPEALAIACLVLAFLSTFYAPVGPGFFGQVFVDSLSRSAFSIVLLGAILVMGILPTQFGKDTIRCEASALILFSLCGVGLMVSGQHLMTLFLGLELLSIPLYILAGLRTSDQKSRESALKYFILGAFASALILFGMALLLAETGSLSIANFFDYFKANSTFHPTQIFYAGWILVSIGMLFKIGAVPFHMWVLDVYQGAPSSVTAFMTFAPKVAAFLVLLKIWPIGWETGFTNSIPLVYFLSMLTMTAGNFMALVQRNVKRMLAYSSIAHAGYMLMAFLVTGREGRYALLFYLGVYALANIGAFAAITIVSPKKDPDLSIVSLSGLVKIHAPLAVAFSICLFSLTGLPPFGGFMAKFFLLKAVINSGNGAIAVVAILNSLLAAYYYLRLVLVMTAKEPTANSSMGQFPLGLGSRIVLALAILGVIVSGLTPDIFSLVIRL